MALKPIRFSTARHAAIVLAGGSATRMGGGDKPLLELHGRTLLAHVLAALGPMPGAISANGDPARLAAFGRPVLDDGAFMGQGPLAGVLAGLRWSASIGADALLSVPGDTPFIPVDLAAHLQPAPACAASLGRRHALVALWPVGAADTLASWLARPGSRGVRRFADSIGMRVVDFAADAGDPFANINTPEDLRAARDRAR